MNQQVRSEEENGFSDFDSYFIYMKHWRNIWLIFDLGWINSIHLNFFYGGYNTQTTAMPNPNPETNKEQCNTMDNSLNKLVNILCGALIYDNIHKTRET